MGIKRLTHDELEKLAQNITAPVTRELIARQKGLEEQVASLSMSINDLTVAYEREISRKDEREQIIASQLSDARTIAHQSRQLHVEFQDLAGHVQSIKGELEKRINKMDSTLEALMRWREHILSRLTSLGS